jgi:hypothetical protein
MSSPLRFALAALLAALPVAAGAQESVLDRPIEKEGWPVEVTRRPLTLAESMIEVTVPLGIGLSRDRSGRPITLSPSLYYGVSDGLTVGIRHFAGLCFSGTPDCPRVYEDVSVDSLWRLWRGVSTDLALGVAVNASPVTDPLALSAEARLVGRLRAGPAALMVAPTFAVGLTNRDTAAVRTAPLAFPLATAPFGYFQGELGNHEFLRVPVSLAVQATPALALALGASLDGPLSPPAGSFSDRYTIPVGAALVFSPSSLLDVGASLTFLNLLGKEPAGADRTDARAMQAFVTGRL